MINLICVCRHEKSKHTKAAKLGYPDMGRYGWIGKWLMCNVWDVKRGPLNNCKCPCGNFRLDNLATIEYLAKKRNLM